MRSCREKYRPNIFVGRVRHATHAIFHAPPHLLGSWTAEGGPLDKTVVESRCEGKIQDTFYNVKD